MSMIIHVNVGMNYLYFDYMIVGGEYSEFMYGKNWQVISNSHNMGMNVWLQEILMKEMCKREQWSRWCLIVQAKS